ncbi:MAG: glycosyltransferase, partial [Patescibacteria group bacterium]
MPYVSGVTVYIDRVAKELTLRGHDVRVLCMRHTSDLLKTQIQDEVKIIRARPDVKVSKGFLSFDFVIKAWVQVRECDVLVINLPQVEGFVPAFFGKLLGKKIVAIYHCEIDYPNKIVQGVVEAANWLTLRLARKIIVYTEDYAKASKLLAGFLDKTVYVYPPVPQPSGSLDVKKPKGQVWVGMAARLAVEKVFEYLIQALEHLDRNVIIVVAVPLDPH